MITTESTQELINRLFKVGGHFGFRKSRRHPTVTEYLYGTKGGTDIIDLEKTAAAIARASEVVADTARQGGEVVFVGTKQEVQQLVRDIATAAGAPSVSNRWVGGMLTNFSELKKRINRLAELVAQGESGELDRKYTKKERVLINREMQKLNFNFGGIRKLERLPKLLVVVDTRHDHIAVSEARELKIPVVAIASSDNDLARVTYPIVVNDSLVASVRTVLDTLAQAYAKGKSEYVPQAVVRREHESTTGERPPQRRFRPRREREGGERRSSGEGRPRHHTVSGARPQAARAPRAQA